MKGKKYTGSKERRLKISNEPKYKFRRRLLALVAAGAIALGGYMVGNNNSKGNTNIVQASEYSEVIKKNIITLSDIKSKILEAVGDDKYVEFLRTTDSDIITIYEGSSKKMVFFRNFEGFNINKNRIPGEFYKYLNNVLSNDNCEVEVSDKKYKKFEDLKLELKNGRLVEKEVEKEIDDR